MAWWLFGAKTKKEKEQEELNNKIKELIEYNEKQKRLAEEEKAEYERKIEEQQKQLEEQQKQFEEQQSATAEREFHPDRERYKNSTTPWVEIVGEEIDPDKGIRIKLDWNDAFIKHLKDNNFQGSDEVGIVQKWLANIAYQVASDMQQQSFDNMTQDPEFDLDIDGEE